MTGFLSAMSPKYVGNISLVYVSVCRVHMAYMFAWLEDKMIRTKKRRKNKRIRVIYYNENSAW